MSELYHIVFEGEIQEEMPRERVVRNLSRLYKSDTDAVEKIIFCGKPMALSRPHPLEAARRFKVAVERTGAKCRIVPHGGEVSGSREEKTAPAPEDTFRTSPHRGGTASPPAPPAYDPAPLMAAARRFSSKFGLHLTEKQASHTLPALPVSRRACDVAKPLADISAVGMLVKTLLCVPGASLAGLAGLIAIRVESGLFLMLMNNLFSDYDWNDFGGSYEAFALTCLQILFLFWAYFKVACMTGICPMAPREWKRLSPAAAALGAMTGAMLSIVGLYCLSRLTFGRIEWLHLDGTFGVQFLNHPDESQWAAVAWLGMLFAALAASPCHAVKGVREAVVCKACGDAMNRLRQGRTWDPALHCLTSAMRSGNIAVIAGALHAGALIRTKWEAGTGSMALYRCPACSAGYTQVRRLGLASTEVNASVFLKKKETELIERAFIASEKAPAQGSAR